MDHLQPIPQVALKCLRMINEGGYAIDQLAEEIRKDQVISRPNARPGQFGHVRQKEPH